MDTRVATAVREKARPMTDQTSVLVCGINETASAVARMLLLSGYAVAMHQPTPPTTLRRKMSFADAWHDGASMLDGVQARRADLSSDFLIGLRNRMFIPVLIQTFGNVERWAWDVIVDAKTPRERREPIELHAGLTIALGPGPVAGVDCDLVIEVFGPNAGAIIRSGAARLAREKNAVRDGTQHAVAPETGIFRTGRITGEVLAADEPLGLIGATPVHSPVAGRIRGLQRDGRSVSAGEAVADIVTSSSAQVSGIERIDQMIARGVVFAIETELNGLAPVSLDRFLPGRKPNPDSVSR
jgi:xanthine dehydrogenase accessory factor